MKQGWEIKTIGSICDIKTGKLDANAASNDGVYPFFTCSQEPLRIDKYAYDCECVLIAGNGDLNVKYYNGKFNAYQRTYIITLKKDVENISVKFLYKFFSKYIEQLRKLSIGAVIKYIKLGNLTEACILVPPLAEQERIVEVLDREFEKIDALKANAEQNLQYARDLFQAALRQELQPKEGWKQYLLADVCEYKKEQGYHTHLPFVGMENIESGTGKLIGCQNGEKILSTTFRFQKGFVMYGRLRPYLKKVFVADFEGCCSTEIFPIVVNGVLPNLLMYWFLSDFTTDKINATCGGCRMPRANMNVVKQFYIWLPLLEEQEQIVARLDILNERCKALEENYKKTIALCDDMKQALLRKAFNGEL